MSAPWRLGQALADEDDGVLGDAVLGVLERADRLGLGAGGGRDEAAVHLASGRARRRAPRTTTCVRPRLAALRSRRKIVAASSSGSRPSEHDDGRGLEVGVGDVAGQRDVGGEEVGLLGGVRAGAEVDVVGAEGDAGELGVGVGVLGGQPATGEHGAGAGVAQAAGGDGEGLGPRRGPQLAVTVQGRGPSGR